MKKTILLLLLLVSSVIYSQKNGITYQAIIFNPNGGKVPGINNTNAPLANKNICLQFTIVDTGSRIEYQETINTTTDEFGMVNTIIGSGNQSAGYALSFSDIYWTTDQKSLKVALDINGKCSNFVEISNQAFTSVPSAFSALNAENVTGVVPIESGGTNAITVVGAKTNLVLENVDNTNDLNKPISLATTAALNLKENSVNKSLDITIDGASNIKYPTVKSVKTYVDASGLSGTVALISEINRATTVEGVLFTSISNEASIRGIEVASLMTNLNSEVSRATTSENSIAGNLATENARALAAEATKENAANKSADVSLASNSDVKFPTEKAVKAYVDASATSGASALGAEINRATAAETANINAISAEALTARAAELANANAIVSNTAAINSNAAAISAEALTARAAESANANAIVSNTAAINSNATAISAEALTARAAESANANAIVSNTAAINTNAMAISAESLTARAAELANANAIVSNTAAINTNAAAISAEALTARAAELTNANAIVSNTAAINTNAASISTEALTARAAELANASAIVSNTVAINTNAAAISTEALTARTAESANANAIVSNTAAINTNAAAISAEALTARAAESANANAIVSNTAAINTNAASISTEALTARAAELANSNAIVSNSNAISYETKRAGLAEQLNTNAITEEASTSRTAESANAMAIVDETSRATAAELVNSNLIAAEAATARIAEGKLTNNLAAEITNRTNADALKANLASPTFTGIPLAPTAEIGTKTTQLATTGFVNDAVTGKFVDLTTSQTIVGKKTFNSDIDIKGILNVTGVVSSTLSMENTVLETGTWGADQWQSFTATVSGRLDKISVFGNGLIGDRTGTLTIYRGTGTSGSQIYSGATALPPSSGWFDLTIGSDLNLVTGQVYTFRLEDQNQVSLPGGMIASTNNRYTQGNYYSSAYGADSNYDLNFKLWVGVLNGGNVNAISFVTAGGTSSQFLKADGSVDANSYVTITAAAAAISTVQSNVDLNILLSDTADTKLTNSLVAEAVTARTAETANANAIVSNTADINTNAAAISAENTRALLVEVTKEDAMNKSADVNLGTSDVLFPTQNATKTYVDSNVNSLQVQVVDNTIQTNELQNQVIVNHRLTEDLQNRMMFDRFKTQESFAAKEDAMNKSADVNLGTSDVLFPTQNATKTYVDSNVNSLQVQVVHNTIQTDKLQNRVMEDRVQTQDQFTSNQIQTQESLNTKEDSANKSYDGTLADATNTKFPTELAVKTYVDGQIAAANATYAISVGAFAGETNKGLGSIALGAFAGNTNQGNYSIALGLDAGKTDQSNNSIILNASGAELNSTTSGLFVNPIRSASGSSSLFYDTTTKEITYGSDPLVSLISSVTGVLPIANGGTGSTTKDFVDLTNAQTIAGAKIFSSDLKVNGLTIGKGAGTNSYNSAVGNGSLNSNSTGDNNSAIGRSSLYSNTTGNGNTAAGEGTLYSNTSGTNNTAVGYNANVSNGALTNATAVGAGAIVGASNVIQLGNTSVINVKTSGTLTTGEITYPKTMGVSGQVLTSAGNGTATWSTASGPLYASSTVQQNDAAATLNSQIDFPGLSFHWNKDTSKLEILVPASNAPVAITYYFSYQKDGVFTVSYTPTAINTPYTGSWMSLDTPFQVLPAISGAYAVYEFNFTTYPQKSAGLNQFGKTYNVKIFLDGWQGVHIRAAYY